MKKTLPWMAILAALSTSVAVDAGESGWYVGGELGYGQLDDARNTLRRPPTAGGAFLSIPGLLDLFPAPGTAGEVTSFNTSHDDGAILGATLGYLYSSGLRLESELRYASNDIESVSLIGGGSADSRGDVSSLSLLGNAWFDFNQTGVWHPYVGGGIGFSQVEYDGIAVGNSTGGFGGDDTVLAYQVGGGIGYDYSPRTTFDLGLRYFATDDPEVSSGSETLLGEYTQTAALLSVRYIFATANRPDSDGDGVPDIFDKCPNTVAGAPVDADGCPLDSDGDGVPDYADKCPNTPAGVPVDDTGCPLDSDGDGVPDYKDDCPNTPKGTQVNASGCPLVVDSDGDGVPDDRDKCPDTPPGQPVTTDGCAVGQSTVLQGVKFEFNSARLTPNAEQILIGVAETLKDSPGFNVEVAGHTDSIGSDAYNLELSQERTESAVEFLVGQGIDRSRMVARGYGESQPVAPNVNPDGSDNPEGRARNRRVELKVVGQR